MNWTAEQQRAIEEQGNLIVSAAAGAGKTAVLTERVVRLVEGGMDIDRLLILTFTRAAAAQMKERIQTALQQRAAASEGPTRARLYRQSARCPNASISTIHSFCRRVVDRYFHLVGLSPSAATLDETESAVLRDQATEEALTALATEDAPSYKRLIRAFEREDGVKGALNALTAFLMAQPDPAGWLDQAEEDLTSREAFDRGVLVCFDEDKATFEAALEDLIRLRDGYPAAWGKLIANLDETIAHGRGTLLQRTPADYAQALGAVAFSRITYPKDMEEADKKILEKARTRVKDEIKDQLSIYEGEMDRNIKVFTAALEPIFIVVVALVVGFIAISILSAVFKVTTGLGSGA